MPKLPLKTILAVVALAAGGYILSSVRKTTPACSAPNEKYMASVADCQAWGVDAAICKSAVEKARAVAAQAAPKTETMFQCELRFSDCFENPAGGYTPRPAFCLRPDGQPTEIRYLEYESDRRNRKKTKEVRIEASGFSLPEKNLLLTEPSKKTSVSAAKPCDIKGNVNSAGEKIYHLPQSRDYDRVKIGPHDRMFCSEAEATAAGWRPAAR